MRFLVIASLLAASGCTVENELRFLSTLPAETRGVVMSEDGIESYVAMRGTTCAIQTSWGCPTVDVDLPTAEESIVDHFEGLTLAQSAVGVHQLSGSSWDAANDLVVGDVQVARLSAYGSLVLHGGAGRCVLMEDGAIEVDVPDAACDAVSADVDRAGGALWLATGREVLRVGVEGLERWDAPDDLLAYDDALRVTYLSESNTRKLRAVDDLGRALWSVTTQSRVRAVATRGGRGDVLVLGEQGSRGLLERRSGATGELLASYDMPTGDGTLVVSANGVGLSIQLEDEVHYYVLEIPGEPRVIDEEPVVCIDLLDRTSID